MEKEDKEKINALYERIRNLECIARRGIVFFWVAITAFVISIVAISGAFCGAPVRNIAVSNETAFTIIGIMFIALIALHHFQVRRLNKKIKELEKKIN